MATWAIDRLRSRALKLGGAPVRVVVRDRALRVSLVFGVTILTSFVLAGLAPLWAMLLGPLVLGVPHLLADLRYLVVRPGYHRRVGLVLAVGAPLLAVSLGGGIALGLLAPLGAALLAEGRARRKLVVLVVLGALYAAALTDTWTATLLFAHAHNFIAVALWWRWAPRGALALLPVGLFFFLAGAVLLGAVDTSSLVLDDYARALAPLEGPMAARLVVLFAFAQAVHYGLWLRVIPEDDRGRATPRTFRATWRALRTELGAPLLALLTLCSAGLVAWALVDLHAARDGYLRLATFHGYLELAAAALLVVEGRRHFAARLS